MILFLKYCIFFVLLFTYSWNIVFFSIIVHVFWIISLWNITTLYIIICLDSYKLIKESLHENAADAILIFKFLIFLFPSICLIVSLIGCACMYCLSHQWSINYSSSKMPFSNLLSMINICARNFYWSQVLCYFKDI